MARLLFNIFLLFSLASIHCLATPVKNVIQDGSLNSTKGTPEINIEAVSNRAVDISIGIDVLGIGQAIASAISSSENRDAFVKNLAYTAFYQANAQYNVMVFNLNQAHEEHFNNVKLYASANYDGIIFGIWVFESGEFRNNGDGGYINWAFIGWFDRDGGYVNFH